MKPLVVFYSRTGATKRVGETLAEMLDCDSEELLDTKKRSGPLGLITTGRDAQAKKLTTLADIKHDPASYDLVILGTPIWGGTLSSAMRTYITTNKSKFKRVAFFCTQGGTENPQLFDEMEALCERRPVNVLALRDKEVKKGAYQDKLRQFADGL
ncbi:MAG: flavodoxin domain-containing protein [Halobacteriota archaeon]